MQHPSTTSVQHTCCNTCKQLQETVFFIVLEHITSSLTLIQIISLIVNSCPLVFPCCAESLFLKHISKCWLTLTGSSSRCNLSWAERWLGSSARAEAVCSPNRPTGPTSLRSAAAGDHTHREGGRHCDYESRVCQGQLVSTKPQLWCQELDVHRKREIIILKVNIFVDLDLFLSHFTVKFSLEYNLRLGLWAKCVFEHNSNQVPLCILVWLCSVLLL